MNRPQNRLRRASLLLFLLTASALAAEKPAIQGIVTDPTGAAIVHASVDLLSSGRVVASTLTTDRGHYNLLAPAPGWYQLRAASPHFAEFVSSTIELNIASRATLDLQLSLASLAQQVSVTATGIPTIEGHLASAVTVLDHQELEHVRDAQDFLRLIPGLQATQTGQPGGTSSLFIRGGNSDANKVLVDDIPMNDIGGSVEFANIATTGIARAEVLRGPNSALYGPDALAGVVSFTTQRGSTPLPELTYSVDGGSFGSYRQEGVFSGVFHQLDYLMDDSRFDTSNAVPLDEFHNGTLVGNFGIKINPQTSLRATIRHDRIASGEPNAIGLYGIPSDALQQNEDAYLGVTLDNRTADRWHQLLRYGALRLRSNFTVFAPTGIPQYDSQGNLLGYLGAQVTIQGANGHSVSGQAQYQYVETYPNRYATSSDGDFVYAQTDYRFSTHLVGLGAFRYEDERGYSGTPSTTIERGNLSYTLQLQGDVKDRLFYTAGSGIEKNQLFGLAGTPRASLAYSLLRPAPKRFLSGTKLRTSFGRGIKEPNLSDQTSSLYALLAALPNGAQLISQYRISQIGAENSRTYDGGVDQLFADGRGRLSVTYFHNEFTNGIEYIPQQGLIELGVPAAVADAAQYGATENSQAFRAQGVEVESEYQAGNRWSLRGGYTYLDSVVQRSFSSDAIGPSFNPNFPKVPIGVYTPLIDARPFRRAPHSGYFGFNYSGPRLSALLTATLVGRRDDSDFLQYDANNLTTLLLPNRNLDATYQRIDLSGSYRVSRSLSFYASAQNLLSQHYSEAFGYPAMPFAFRSGMQFTFGGESWKLR